MEDAVKDFLRRKRRVSVQDQWLKDCISSVKQNNQGRSLSPQQLSELVFHEWLLADLQEIGTESLPRGVSSEEIFTLQGNFCLQINAVRDAGQPAYSQLLKLRGQDDPEKLNNDRNSSGFQWKAKPTRMLTLELTDGIQHVEGMEYQPIPALQATTTPGTKIEVSGNVTCRLGMLLLTAANVKVLGGQVTQLEEQNSMWKLLHRDIGLEPPANGPVKTEFQPNGGPQYNNAATQPVMESVTSRVNDITETYRAKRAATSNHRQHGEPKQESMRSSAAAADNQPGNVATGSRQFNSAYSPSAMRNCGSMPQNPTATDEMEYLDFDEADEKFDFAELDQLEQEGQRSSEPVDAWMGEFDDFPDDEFLFEDNAEYPNLNEVNSGNQESGERIENPSQSLTGSEHIHVGYSNSSDCVPGHGEILDHDSVTSVKARAVLMPGQGSLKLSRPKYNGIELGVKRHAEEESPTVQGTDVKRECTLPFTYLSQLASETSGTSSTERTIRIKAYIVTLVSHSHPTTESPWNVTVKINDGTATLDVDLAPPVLTELLGLPVEEFQRQFTELKRTRNPTLCQRLQKRTEDFQKKLATVSCLMDVSFSSNYVRPRVWQLAQPTPNDVTLLIHNILAKMPHDN